MKRLICATLASTLALSLLGAGAAEAAPWHGSRGHSGYARGWHGYRHHDDGAAIGLGLGLFALAAIASQADKPRYYTPPPAYGYGPPPPPYGYGPPQGYDW